MKANKGKKTNEGHQRPELQKSIWIRPEVRWSSVKMRLFPIKLSIDSNLMTLHNYNNMFCNLTLVILQYETFPIFSIISTKLYDDHLGLF